ncbi:MAG: DUF3501 family protein [Rhodospirillales bacterium]|nr:DUF3501 family protein [Rhodospirillales bacterium]
MMIASRSLRRSDLLPKDEYLARRDTLSARIEVLRRHRQLALGPAAGLEFHSRPGLWLAFHEAIHVQGRPEADALAECNALMPGGRDLVAGMAFRHLKFGALDGIQASLNMAVGGIMVWGVPQPDAPVPDDVPLAFVVRFVFDPVAITEFRTPGAVAMVACGHGNYPYSEIIPDDLRHTLAGDLD